MNLNDLSDKISELSLSESLDAEASLHLAAEAGNLLLKENESLKQEIHEMKTIQTKLQLSLEDRIKELDEKIRSLTEMNQKKEEEFNQK